MVSLKGNPVSARLELTLYQVQDEGEREYQLYDVVTDAATVNNNVGGNLDIFEDLGSGKPYGSLKVNQPPDIYRDTVVSIPLNSNALDDIKNAQGKFFTIGGKLDSQQTDFWSLFGNSDQVFESIDGVPQQGVQRLVIETDATAAVPEPASMFLFASGLGAMALRRRKKA